MSSAVRSYHPTGLSLWQRCPRQFWFTHVAQARQDRVPGALAAALGVAGHAAMALVCSTPDSSSEQVRDVMLRAFERDLHERQERGTTFDPDETARSLDRLEAEYLPLVMRLAQDGRVRKVNWTHVEARFDSMDRHDRRFAGTINASGVVLEPIPGFGVRDGEVVDLEPGTRVLVDWRFGRDSGVSFLELSLDLPLAFGALGAARLFPGERVRAFAAAVREIAPGRPQDVRGRALARSVVELNPAFVEAFAAGRQVTPELVAEARATRRHFSKDGRRIQKRIRRPNPAFEAKAAFPRGPVFHEARIAWEIVRPTIAHTVRELEAATRNGDEAAFPARGPLTGACDRCPFRSRCVKRASA